MEQKEINIQDYLDVDFYYVEEILGEKQIHVNHCYSAFEDGKFESPDKPFCCDEMTFAIMPFSELLKIAPEERSKEIFEVTCNVTQYCYKKDESEIVEEIKNLLEKGNLKELDYSEITEDTPCGWYYSNEIN